MLPSMILKADFSRYVMLFLFGGIYADLDVKDITPMLNWFDTNRDAGFVCSLEMDSNEPWPYPMPRRNQLQTWFFKSKARHPILRKLIATVIKNTFEAKDKKLVPDYSNDYDPASKPQMLSIMDWTGPPLMTDIVFAHMNSLNNPTVIDVDPIRWNLVDKLNGPKLEPGVGINWRTTTGINNAIMVNDVVIYPHVPFREMPHDGDGIDHCVWHLFSGSWKPS
ncbi:unnamed protein product [Ambrosiozyma monospora]|uniref:Unnamed protein product n=1 Tax=Ambrosiozyma monospora TaxID=43982 RepID=A0ACB5T6J7_AMBMO|nr:unnamed protein product [Ambrosiozyma monospora]